MSWSIGQARSSEGARHSPKRQPEPSREPLHRAKRVPPPVSCQFEVTIRGPAQNHFPPFRVSLSCSRRIFSFNPMHPKPRSSPAARPRFTHFVSFPLRSRSDPTSNFTSSAEGFRNNVINAYPSIGGIHESIVVQPVRMHLTIGLMSLVQDSGSTLQNGNSSNHVLDDPESDLKTIGDALRAFESCRSVVEEITRNSNRQRLDVSFNQLGTFQTNLKKCQVSQTINSSLV